MWDTFTSLSERFLTKGEEKGFVLFWKKEGKIEREIKESAHKKYVDNFLVYKLPAKMDFFYFIILT